MARLAALYDIHGNLPALEAVLDEIRKARVDILVIGGDVFPGPMPRETLDLLLALDLPIRFLRGNGDREVLASRRGRETNAALPANARQAIAWTAQQLSPEQERHLASWPETVRIDLDNLGAALFCHATPRSDTELFTRITPDARVRQLFDAVEASLVVCGHTHMQFDRTVDQLRIINAGSVGMPFEAPGAYWLLLDDSATLRRTDYDFAAAAQRVRETGYPQATEFADRNILQPPSAEEMLAAFAKADTK